MEPRLRMDLAHRTAVSLVPFLAQPRWLRWLRWLSGRGIAIVWRELKPQLAVRPELAQAVRRVKASPRASTQQALVRELTQLFSDDPVLADLTHQELGDEVVARVAHATRVRRWTTALFASGVAVGLAFAIAQIDSLWGGQLRTRQALSGVFIVGVLFLGFGYLYRRVGRIAWLANWLSVLLITAGMLAVIANTTFQQDVEVAKVIAILLLTVLPGWLYFQFVALRGRSLWEDYVLSLFRLGVDEPANLPEPPSGTKAHRLWNQANANPEAGTLYRHKFEAAHGKVVLARHWAAAARRRRGDGFAPVVLLTLLTAFGWTAVLLPFYPEASSLLPITTLGGTATLGGLGGALAFGFVGAYWFNVQSLVRRYFHEDLRANAYISGIVRIIVVLVLVTAVYQVWRWDVGSLYAAAFAIGVFPRLALQVLEKAITKGVSKATLSGRNSFPLTDLDGLNMWYEARLVEEGIEDMQNLATADMVEMLLSTRVPVGRLVDWVDQALLYIRVKDSDHREGLRCLGIRSATDLQDAFPATAAGAGDASLAKPWKGRATKVGNVLWPDEPDPAAAVDLLLSSLNGEINLRKVRSWRSWGALEMDPMPGLSSLQSEVGSAQAPSRP